MGGYSDDPENMTWEEAWGDARKLLGEAEMLNSDFLRTTAVERMYNLGCQQLEMYQRRNRALLKIAEKYRQAGEIGPAALSEDFVQKSATRLQEMEERLRQFRSDLDDLEVGE